MVMAQEGRILDNLDLLAKQMSLFLSAPVRVVEIYPEKEVSNPVSVGQDCFPDGTMFSLLKLGMDLTSESEKELSDDACEERKQLIKYSDKLVVYL